jgi:hypothetical protein
MRQTDLPDQFVELIDDCVSLIDDSGALSGVQAMTSADPLPSLLSQCRQLVDENIEASEPIRLVLHFACTGGTLISKCLASMPNTQVLSEVEPHSNLVELKRLAFAPTDLVQLCKASSRGCDTELVSQVFLAGLEAIYRDCKQKGIRLILRGHPHSHYCSGFRTAETDTLTEVVAREYPCLSLVTVRHPLDSFLSLEAQGWKDFRPFSLEEYSKRYLVFLSDHSDSPIVKYEDFTKDPQVTMRKICEVLSLRFQPGFETLFGVHRLSGDSGRSSARIGNRPRRQLSPEVAREARDSESFHHLCDVLGYDAP